MVDLTETTIAAAYKATESSQVSANILMFLSKEHEDPNARKWSQDTLVEMAIELGNLKNRPSKRNRSEVTGSIEDEEWV